MAYSDVLFEVKNQIAWLTINRPDRGNSFRRQTVLEMYQALNEVRVDANVRVVVITASSASAARRRRTTASSTTTMSRRWWISTSSST
jgi:2-ketocyclohexanecarboxyl-CoA hydrolase